jgi:hypothetical protein
MWRFKMFSIKNTVTFCCMLLVAANAQGKEFFVGSLTEMTNSFHSNDVNQTHIGTGATLGFNAYGADFASDVLNMGTHRFAFAARLGKRFNYGQNWRVNFGIFTGPKVHLDPTEKIQPATLSQQTSLALKSSGIDSDMIQSQFDNTLQSEQGAVSKLAVGWNLAEAQLKLERRVLKRFIIGVSGSAAYQVLLNGTDAIAFSRLKTLDQMDTDLNLAQQDPAVRTQLESDVGARNLGWSDLASLNYRASVHVTLEL